MSTISDKVRSLEELLNERETKLNKKINRTAIIYAVLVCATAAYTFLMVGLLKKQTSPNVLSEVAINLTSQYATEGRQAAIKQLSENSEVLAQTVVDHTIEAIPNAKAPIINSIEVFMDYLDQHMKNELLPAFSIVLKEHANELQNHYKNLKDEEKMQGLALIFVDILELEMDQFISESFISEVFELKKKLLALGKSNTPLTRRQYAQRQVLINWVYLSENLDVGESKLFEFFESIEKDFDSIMDSQEGDDQELEGVGFSNLNGL